MFFLFFACDESLSLLEEKEPTIELTPIEKYDQMEREILDAIRIWEADKLLSKEDANYGEKKLLLKNAKRELILLYQDDFMSLQPELYKNDPVGCIELELKFGEFFQVYGSHRSRDRQERAQELLAKLKEEISELPTPVDDEVPPAPAEETTAD